MFVVTLTYEKPLEEIDRYLAEHRAYLDRHYASEIFLASGPRRPRVGGVILVSGRVSRGELDGILDEDPFKRHGLARYDITEFEPVKHNDALAALI